MTDETEDRDDPARIPGDPDPRYDGYPPMTEDEAAQLDAAEAAEQHGVTLFILTCPMDLLEFDAAVTEVLAPGTSLAELLAIGDMQAIAEQIGDPWAVWRFRDRFDEPFKAGDHKVTLDPRMDLAPFLDELRESGVVPQDA